MSNAYKNIKNIKRYEVICLLHTEEDNLIG